MAKFTKWTGIVVAALMLVAAGVVFSPPTPAEAQQSGSQNLLNLSFVGKGVSNQGVRILQTGELSNMTAAVATATLTAVVNAPTTGSTYIRSVAVEKSTGASGTFTLKYGTGTNCGTGTTTIIGPVTNPQIQPYKLGILVPSGNDLCAQTDAATTSVRVLYN